MTTQKPFTLKPADKYDLTDLGSRAQINQRGEYEKRYWWRNKKITPIVFF